MSISLERLRATQHLVVTRFDGQVRLGPTAVLAVSTPQLCQRLPMAASAAPGIGTLVLHPLRGRTARLMSPAEAADIVRLGQEFVLRAMKSTWRITPTGHDLAREK